MSQVRLGDLPAEPDHAAGGIEVRDEELHGLALANACCRHDGPEDLLPARGRLQQTLHFIRGEGPSIERPGVADALPFRRGVTPPGERKLTRPRMGGSTRMLSTAQRLLCCASANLFRNQTSPPALP